MVTNNQCGGTKLSKTSALSQADIKRAAQKLIAEYGEHAFVKASEEISVQISKGIYALAGSWQLIREEVLKQLETQIIRDAPRDDVTLSE
jgi:ribosome biogenesis protein Tsr3